MPKSWRWMESYGDWLIEIPFGDSDITAEGDLWCKYCKKPVKRKKYNALKHATTARHLKLCERKEVSLTNTKNEQILHVSYNDAERMGIEASSPDMGESSLKGSLVRKRRKEIATYEYPTVSYSEPADEFNEVDAFARSIAAQMKTLPEKYIIGLTFEIQNLVTQKRLQAFEDKNSEKQAALEPHVITVSVPNAATSSMQPTSSNYSYQ